MSDQITVARSQQFNATVTYLLQQKASRLRMAVMEGSHTGKQAVAVDQVGLVTAVPKQARAAELPVVTTPHARRWVVPTTYQFRDFVDRPDQLRMLWDPKSPYAMGFAMALGRAIDDQIIGAFFAASGIGETNSSTEAFDTTNFSIASGSVGLNVDKLRTVRRLFRKAEVPEDSEFYGALNSFQMNDLLKETQTTNLDYTNRPVLVDGNITRFMGINFIHTERTQLVSTERAVPFWVKDGMHLGIWEEPKTPIDWLPERQAWQVAGTLDCGATRLEQGRVIRVLCTEA